MIASLPMYEQPGTRTAHDRYWHHIRTAHGYGPDHLTRNADPWDHWRSPELLLSQTCGMPYRNHLHGTVQLVGTPDYGLSDQPGYYHSVYVARSSDSTELAEYADRLFAYNDTGSQSGWAAPHCDAAARGFKFSNTFKTHAHAESARAVALGQADIAAIDCVTWELIRQNAELSGLAVIDRTPSSPGLPYITCPNRDADALFSAVAAAIDALTIADRAALKLKGITRIPAELYLAIPNPPEE